MSNDKMREEFESWLMKSDLAEWVKDVSIDENSIDHGDYFSEPVNLMFAAWQAASDQHVDAIDTLSERVEKQCGNRHDCQPAGEAVQPDEVQAQAGWKHDCAALLTNDVELWIDSCPHCGKPRQYATCQDEVQRAVEAEREACARLCETAEIPINIDVWMRTKKELSEATAIGLAAAIRARSNKH